MIAKAVKRSVIEALIKQDGINIETI